jgi:hypothetical protein
MPRLRKENFKDALWSFLFTLVIGILPTWGLFILLKFYKQPIGINPFTENGEFALYSSSMMAAILYILVKDYIPHTYKEALKKRRFSFVIRGAVPFQNILMFFSVLIILLSTFFFVGVVIAKLPGAQGLSPDKQFLSISSLVLFIIASIVSFFTTALDNAASTNYNDTDFHNDVDVQQSKLANELDVLLEDK